MGDTEKMVLDVYNHIMEEKEDAAAVVNDVLAIWFWGHNADIRVNKHLADAMRTLKTINFWLLFTTLKITKNSGKP